MSELIVEREDIGTCLECAGAIEPEYLNVYPQARICLDCMAERDLRALEDDLALAQEENESLLPRRLPQDGAWEIGIHYRPSRILSGDFYDFMARPEPGALALAVGDVSGKGISAGLLRSGLQATLRALSQESFSPKAILDRSHRLFLDASSRGRFATVFYGIVDPQRSKLVYANAGHNPPLLRRATGAVEELKATGSVLGALQNTRFDQAETSLEPGDLLVLYTDGVTEASDAMEQFYGEGRLAAALDRWVAAPLQEIANRIVEDLLRFAPGEPSDDRTLVLFRERRPS